MYNSYIGYIYTGHKVNTLLNTAQIVIPQLPMRKRNTNLDKISKLKNYLNPGNYNSRPSLEVTSTF